MERPNPYSLGMICIPIFLYEKKYRNQEKTVFLRGIAEKKL
jgi:hypothetical protein